MDRKHVRSLSTFANPVYDLAMSGSRALRLALVIISDGILFLLTGKILLDPSEARFWRVFALAVCAGALAGIAFEIGKCKAARKFNVSFPAILGAILASSFIWLPMLAKILHWEHPGDAQEGAAYLFAFSLLPFLLACITELGYRLIDIET
jgi:hypothetical protein